MKATKARAERDRLRHDIRARARAFPRTFRLDLFAMRAIQHLCQSSGRLASRKM